MKRPISFLYFGVLLCALLFFRFTSHKQTDTTMQRIVVSSSEELTEQLNLLDEPDTLYIANGIYTHFEVTIAQSGEKEIPLVIMAETPGKVLFADSTVFEVTGNYVELNGFYFQDSAKGDKEPPLITLTGDYNRVTQCAFWGCTNRVAISSIFQSEEQRMPQYNSIDYCYFADNMGWNLYLDLGKTPPTPDTDYAMYYRVSHCYFSTPFKMGKNTGSAMRLGLGPQSGYGRCLIDNNLFERQNGEAELIENKSSENIYINNTFKNCESDMSFRQGHRTAFLHNHFVGTDSHAKSGGLSLWMDGAIVAGNYFSFPYGSYIPLGGGVKMIPRDDRKPAAAVHLNCGYRTHNRPSGVYASHLAAHDNHFVNNLFEGCVDYLFNLIYTKNNLHQFGSEGSVPYNNTLLNNDVVGGDATPANYIYKDSDSDAAGNSIETPHFLTATSSNLNIAPTEQTYPLLAEMQGWLAQLPGDNKDFDLQKLANTKPATLSASGSGVSVKLLNKPLSFEDVGPTWLSENPSEFAQNGYSAEIIQAIVAALAE